MTTQPTIDHPLVGKPVMVDGRGDPDAPGVVESVYRHEDGVTLRATVVIAAGYTDAVGDPVGLMDTPLADCTAADAA